MSACLCVSKVGRVSLQRLDPTTQCRVLNKSYPRNHRDLHPRGKPSGVFVSLAIKSRNSFFSSKAVKMHQKNPNTLGAGETFTGYEVWQSRLILRERKRIRWARSAILGCRDKFTECFAPYHDSVIGRDIHPRWYVDNEPIEGFYVAYLRRLVLNF